MNNESPTKPKKIDGFPVKEQQHGSLEHTSSELANGFKPKKMESGLSRQMEKLAVSQKKSKPRSAPDKRFLKYLGEGSSTQARLRPFKKFRPVTSKVDQKKTHEPQILVKLTTVMVANLFHQCNPKFVYKSSIRPKRALSKPSKGVLNSGQDNAESNLIMYANDILHSETGDFRSFRVEEMLGKGTFGQVVKAEDLSSKKKVAIKVIKNKPAYYNQAIIEIQILRTLNRRHDPDNKNNIVRLYDHFLFKSHLCLVFELLSVNLYELIKQNRFRGLSCNLIRTILKQILRAVRTLESAGIIHCDLKPENILLQSLTSAKIKLIDFGSACNRNQTIYSYIQSRFYRSPEVLLGLPYDQKIDMWSIGCVAAELFLGLPLFPGVSAFNQVYRIVEMLGVPAELLRRSKKTKLYFNYDKLVEKYEIKSIKQYAEENKREPVHPKRYFKEVQLETLIMNYPYRRSLAPQEKEAEKKTRETFISLVAHLLKLHPKERATPTEALRHAFIGDESASDDHTNDEKNSSLKPKKNLESHKGKRNKVNEPAKAFHPFHPQTSAPVPIRDRSGSFHTAGSHPSQRYIPHATAEEGQYYNTPSPGQRLYRRGVQSQAIMINPAIDKTFTREMADHTPVNHTPIQRAGAHPHSLTIASTPMRGSPSGLFMAPGMSPTGSGNSAWPYNRNSPMHHSPLRNSGMHIGSPNRGGARPLDPSSKFVWWEWAKRYDVWAGQYGSPEIGSHPHSWGPNHGAYLGSGAPVGSYKPPRAVGFNPRRSTGFNPPSISGFSPQNSGPAMYSTPSTSGFNPTGNSSGYGMYHTPSPVEDFGEKKRTRFERSNSYSHQPQGPVQPSHQQRRYGHFSPLKKFQPPLRNLVRGNNSHSKKSGKTISGRASWANGVSKPNDRQRSKR
eukprot:CAMPEP_0114493850 /NCGR_PEP_ID=MMETSP0109-20121206/4330_1 /TAXON_ID=29199 /ORGANISM="Chlorarachnion reptans, Strain CCCM449" /LENGTH=897 /DNA_ID=CAMNT_0001670831 /DNA_START=413 /DNA_END=3105 /DNA_ORIENTATION=-